MVVPTEEATEDTIDRHVRFPADLYDALSAAAERDGRTVQKQLEYELRQRLMGKPSRRRWRP